MLSAAPRTSTYGAGCPKICIRMRLNIPRAFSLIFRTLSSTTASVRPPETLPYPAGAALPSVAPPRPSEAIVGTRALATTRHKRATYRSHEADEGRNDGAGKS
jgi:hypothetical protein